MKSLTKVLVIFLAVVLANALHVWGQQQSLTRDNISQLTLADSISVGDFVDVDFDASGQHFVVGGNSIGVSTYDRQTEPIIEGAVLANRLKHLTLASDASLFLGTFENSSGTNFAQIFQFDSIPLEGDAPVIIFDSVPNEVLLIENNQTLLVALEDGRLATYATSTQALIQTWQAHVGSVTDVRYDSQTQTIYSVGSDNWLYGWSLNGAKIFEAQLSSGTPKSLIGSGDLAFVQSDAQSLDAVDLNSAQVVFSINLGMDALAVGFQSSTNTIVGVDANGLIRMWDADSGAFVSQSVFYELNALPLQVMVIDPLTDQVVVGGMDGKLHWLDVAGAIQQTRVPSGETSYTAIAAYNDWIAINARDDTVRVWNLQQQQWQFIDEHPSGFMAFSGDGRWLAAIGDNAIVTWDTSASFTKQVYPFDTLQFPNHIHFVQNSSLLAIAKRTEFTVVDASTGNVQGSISTGDEQNNITSITSNGNYLVAGFRDGTIRFWQLPGLTEIPNWIVQTTGPVVDLEFGHTALDLFSASYTSRPGHPADNSYQYWRLSSALDIAPEPGWNFPIRFGRGEFELVPNGTAGVELHEDGFMAFASEPDYLFSGRNEYDASTPSLHITIANGGLYVVVGSPNELSVWGDGITLPTLPPTPTPPPPPFPTYGVGPFSVFGTIQSPFGQGVAPAVIGIKGWHQNTLDVMPVHLEECLADLNNLSTGNYSSCDPSDGQGVEIFSPIGGAVHVIQDGQGENSQVVIRPNGVVLTINIGGQQVDVYPEIHFSHLDPGTVSGGGASAGGALARLCTEANKSSCDLGQRDPSHLAYAVRFQSVANFDRHSPDVLNARAVIASPHCLYDEFETQSFATCPGN